MPQVQETLSLRRFTVENDIPYGTCRNWLLAHNYDTSNGLSPEAQAAALDHFKGDAEPKPQPQTPAAAMVHLDSGDITVSIPGHTQRGDAETALDRARQAMQQTAKFPSETLSFSGLEGIEAELKQRLEAAAAKREQLNQLVNLIGQRYAEITRLRDLQQQADSVDADNGQLEEQIATEAKKLQEYQAALQQLQ